MDITQFKSWYDSGVTHHERENTSDTFSPQELSEHRWHQ